MKKKLEHLKQCLRSMRRVLIAYSGGVDSTFLLKVASDVLDGAVLAVTARSQTFPRQEEENAVRMAKRLGVRHSIIKTNELQDRRFVQNDYNRCYWCKHELFSRLCSLAKRRGIPYVADGSNYDDINDYRPGRSAMYELGVRSPLIEARLTKKEIRKLSRSLHLPTFDKPSFACLASRFPYGTTITSQLLRRIAQAEDIVRKEGFTSVRVRHHGNSARIEVAAEEIPMAMRRRIRERICARLKKLGYVYVTIDLDGYRTGSMNEVMRKSK